MNHLIEPRRSKSARARALQGAGALASAVLVCGCRDLDRFDTGPYGAYCGRVVEGEFTRRGFTADLGLRLTLDVEALSSEPGAITTDDASTGPCSPRPEFDGAPLVITRELLADPLSQLEFGSTRDYNFVAWVDSTCQGSALAVVSLMRTGGVEVRLLRRGTSAAPSSPGEFALFQLERTDCEF